MISAIVFDLGNVLLHFDNHLLARRLAGVSDASEEEFWEFLHKDPLQHDLDTGRIDPESFYERLRERYSLRVSYAEFLPLWCEIFSPVPGMEELVASLKGKYRLDILSNTNQMHFKYIRETYGIVRQFDHYHVSYELGAAKPDPFVYRRLIGCYGNDPSGIVYTDDIGKYVEAAAGLGINAIQFQSAEQLKEALRSLGVKL